MGALPKPLHMIGIKFSVIADDGHVFRLGLCNQHSIEWIFVKAGKKSRPNGMLDTDRQFLKAFALDVADEVLGQFDSIRQSAQSHFCRNLPSRNSADQDLVGPVAD